MDLPTRSASSLIFILIRLWMLKPVGRKKPEPLWEMRVNRQPYCQQIRIINRSVLA